MAALTAFWVMPSNSSVVMTLPCLAEMATMTDWDRLTALVTSQA